MLAGVYRTAKEFATALAANIANSAKSAVSLAEVEASNSALKNDTGSSLISYLMYKGPLPDWFSLRSLPIEVAEKHINKLAHIFAVLTCANIGLTAFFCLLWAGLLIWYCNQKMQLKAIEEEERRLVVKKHLWREAMKKRAKNLKPDSFLRKQMVKAALDDARDDEDDDDA